MSPGTWRREILCSGNERLLDVCLRACIRMSLNCRSDECGECNPCLVAGEVGERPSTDPADIYCDSFMPVERE